MNQFQHAEQKFTKLKISFQENKGILQLNDQIDRFLDVKQSDLSQVNMLKFQCKPSIETLILNDFKKSMLKLQMTKPKDLIILKVTQRKLKLRNCQQIQHDGKLVTKIQCQGTGHTRYILALIRSVWQQKMNKKQQHLKIQDVISVCEMYISQFQLQIDDLIEIFQAPLTTEYGRL